MAKYIVSKKEVWYRDVEIDADNEEEALERVNDGEGAIHLDPPDYSHTLGYDEWKVKKQ